VNDFPQQQEIGMPPETVTGGGPIPWFSVSLSIHSDDLDPDEVTRVLGIKPDQTQHKGVPWPPRGDRPPLIPTIGMWSIKLRPEQAPGCDVATAIVKVLDRITVPLDVWHRIRAGTRARIFVGLNMDQDNRGFGLEPALLRRAVDLGIALDFDIYSYDDDEPDDEGPAFP